MAMEFVRCFYSKTSSIALLYLRHKRNLWEGGFMKKSKENLIGRLIIVISIILTIIGYVFLPKDLVVQVTPSGEARYSLPKILALSIPFAISTLFSILYMQGEPKFRRKNLILSILGIVVFIFIFLANYGG